MIAQPAGVPLEELLATLTALGGGIVLACRGSVPKVRRTPPLVLSA